MNKPFTSEITNEAKTKMQMCETGQCGEVLVKEPLTPELWFTLYSNIRDAQHICSHFGLNQ